MKLTPLDIRKQMFRKTMRGFDPEDVRVFLDLVADEYEQLLQENGMLSEKVRHLDEQIERYHSMERTLQNSLLTAERVSEEARERARLEAEEVVDDARQRGERILEDSRERLQLLGRQVQELHQEKERFTQRLLAFLEGQIKVLRDHEEELEEISTLEQRAAEVLDEARRPLSAEPPGEPAPSEDPADGDAAPVAETEPAAKSPTPAPAEAPAVPEAAGGAPVRASARGADPAGARAPLRAPRAIHAAAGDRPRSGGRDGKEGFFVRAEDAPGFFDGESEGRRGH